MITLTPITEVHEDRLAERDAQIATLTAENERLREVLEESYALNQNYYAVAADDHQFTEAPAVIAQARAALQPKEGE